MKNTGKKTPVKPRTGQSRQTVQLKKTKTKAVAGKVKAKRRSPSRQYDRLDESMYMEQEEKDAFFDAITSKRDTAIFRVVYHRGLRAHEVGLLQLSDFRKDKLQVHRGKGSLSGWHSLTRAEMRALNLWVRERGTDKGPLFPSRNHQPITRQRLDQLIKRYCADAGIAPEKAHMHALKHSTGTHLAERGDLADEIKDHLGHRDIKSTNIYMHFSKKRRAEMALRHLDWK